MSESSRMLGRVGRNNKIKEEEERKGWTNMLMQTTGGETSKAQELGCVERLDWLLLGNPIEKVLLGSDIFNTFLHTHLNDDEVY